ncbi:terminase family protein [Phaeobacter gallaeciensis]|uniref:DNA-packaging protein n=1 Tax=Phaeobacter gallaeciensis TaxID=60890 RepID=UPI00237F5D35|nr:terminase family protein [Phaeobacter gallaeciensis]MDE4304388.1 terminase family protein [Phaeobacter gallaeciensis]MDE4308269.1 terminase family protein [Phaeobacter gallaeciensis]MDE4312726.1 terminase family protein [Phaeobacter gallaeciensis]MDE4317319.1 terminase family protein [Phaeobacter gallaeciensis]MDE4321782.1 terminase family protein [Phaeobacter gallaeciensis]
MLNSTLKRPGLKSAAAWIASGPLQLQSRLLEGLSDQATRALPYLFEVWAHPHQLPPEGDWRCWVILGGRGAGKTRAGAEWLRAQVEGATPLAVGKARRVALIAETYDQVRDVMIHGDSGLLACSPSDRRPTWKPSERKLIWANGAMAQAFSAHDPEALRGPQFDAAWADELAKWKKGRDCWDMLQFALRLGTHPQVCVTSTPRNTRLLRDLLARDSTAQSHAATEANRAHLAPSFLTEVRARYAGSRLGRQELDGVLLSDVEGALWSAEQLERGRVETAPRLSRVVVAVDPAVSAGKSSDACGLVVAGAITDGPPQDWRAVVLADRTQEGAQPLAWAQAAIRARDEFDADRLVAEVNQGGALVESVLRQVDPMVPFRALHAARGKAARAEPVAALYEQGRVAHLPGLAALEDQMCQMTARGYLGQGSPDRLDALVWALHELMIRPAVSLRLPRARLL